MAGPAFAQIMDSTGDMGKKRPVYGDTVYSSTWNRVTGKPATFPTTWEQIGGVPPVIRDGTAGLDDRYVQKGLGGLLVGGGAMIGDRCSRWGAARCGMEEVVVKGWKGKEKTVERKNVICPEGSQRQITGYVPSISTKTTRTTPGCDGGCTSTETSTSDARTYYICVG